MLTDAGFRHARALLGCGLALAGAATLTVPGSAHHSTAMFAWGQSAPMRNMTIERWEWTNPHTFIELDLPGAAPAATETEAAS